MKFIINKRMKFLIVLVFDIFPNNFFDEVVFVVLRVMNVVSTLIQVLLIFFVFFQEKVLKLVHAQF